MSSPTKSFTTIEDLPPEMISELFKHLPPKDLVVCSLVNKLWHSIYATFKLHSLVVTDYHPDHDLKWYYSNQLVQQAERCFPAMFYRLVEKPLLSNLKHLAIYVDEPEFDLNKLNRFRQLVYLEFYSFPLNQKRIHLNLPKLKVLRFHSWSDRRSLLIDCPELRTLTYPEEYKYYPNLLEVKRPETIRRLETDMVGEQLTRFKSVECLVIREFKSISKATLLSAPKLKELRYNRCIKGFFFRYDYDEDITVDQLKRTLSEFVDEAKRLRGSDFRFTFSDFELTNVDVEQIDFGVQVDEETGREYVRNEYVYMKNYHLIEPGALHFVDQINYTLLLSNLTGEFPRCFFQKFTDIYWVYTSDKVPDVDQLLWFLKSLRFLEGLVLKKTELSQKFYDQLPASVHSLRSLHLREGHYENELQVNFDFIRKLPALSDLQIDSNFSLESLPSLVGLLGKLKEGQFRVRLKEEDFWIKKWCSTKWEIETVGRLHFEKENAKEIVKFFDDLRETLEIGVASN